MTLSVEGVLCAAFGLVCLVFWKPLGERAYESQRRHFGVRSAPKIYQVAYVLAGVIFLSVGMLLLAGIIRLGK
jgi:hypothetical protein